MAIGWTQEDYDEVKTAIKDLVIGKAVVKVTIDGDTTEYSRADLPQLRSLLNEMGASLTPSVSSFLIVTDKGL